MKIQIEKNYIHLDGAKNMRDLGGYPTPEGRSIKNGVIFRSDSVHQLSKTDIEKIIGLGITLQIDLRSKDEVALSPSSLKDSENVSYHNISMLDDIYSDGFQNLPESLTDIYCKLLDNNGDKFVEAIKLILSNKGATLINCTAGKDRTGVFAMLLLSLCHVDEINILNDYSVSAANLSKLITIQKSQLQKMGLNVPDYIFMSEPDNMLKTLNYLNKNYGNTENYLLHFGLNSTEISKLKEHLTY